MVESNTIRVAVLETNYADIGVPFSVCVQLQERRLQLHDAQWTARNSTGGFSISFFWPALATNQLVKKNKKGRDLR